MTANTGGSAGTLVPKAGFEPARVLPHWFLRPARLPFRHFGRPRMILGNSNHSGQAKAVMSTFLSQELRRVGQDLLRDLLTKSNTVVDPAIFGVDEGGIREIEPGDRRA